VSGKRESHLENGQNFGNASKIGHQDMVMRNSKFEFQKSEFTTAERFPQKGTAISAYKVDIITKKLGSEIRIRLPENSGKALEERRYADSREDETF
jgi:hypothetical protein